MQLPRQGPMVLRMMKTSKTPERPSRPRPASAQRVNDARWAAVVARDAASDGKFVTAVATTGIYCRPSCPARHPLRENIRFYATCEAAEAAGFRPCKRCKPDRRSLPEEHAAKVAEACRLIEAAAEPPKLDQLAAQVGLSPYHFHRIFKSIVGVTPKAYAVAHRNRNVRDRLQGSASVTNAIFSAGFNSSGRFYANSTEVLGMKPRSYRAGGVDEEIRIAIRTCSLGKVLVAASEKGVCAILLGDDHKSLMERVAAALFAREADASGCLIRKDRRQDYPASRRARIERRLAARRARHGLPAPRLENAAGNSSRFDFYLRGGRAPHRRAESGARGRRRVRGKPGSGSDPLPQSREQ